MNKIMIIVIDGCSMEYISKENTPNLYRIAERGFHKTVLSAMPSVTNVNHATILSGQFPKVHRVVGNYYYDEKTGAQGFIESKGFIETETIIEKLKQVGYVTALLTVKGKVLATFGNGVDYGISLEHPNAELLDVLEMGPPPKVGSLEANQWLFESGLRLIQKKDPDFVYCTTNDYMMHNYAPDTEVAITQMHMMDALIGQIYDLNQEREIYITADHGMNQKKRVVDLQRIVDRKGFDMVCHPPLKDRYIENHLYQEGGALYLYLKEKGQTEEILAFLKTCDFIEDVLSKEDAAMRFHLPADMIGDYMALTEKDSAFGELGEGEEMILTDKVRTHGSLYEREIPLFTCNPRGSFDQYQFNRDISKVIIEKL